MTGRPAVESASGNHGPREGMGATVRRLGANSLIYALGNALTSGVAFLMVPVFTRALTPSDYGILAVCTTLTGLLQPALGMMLDGAITQMYFNCRTEGERRLLYGSLTAYWLVVPVLLVLALDLLGGAGLLNLFPSVPFNPYLRLTLWGSLLGLFSRMPYSVFTTRQEPVKATALAVGQSLLTVALSVYLVVYLHRGVVGSLSALLYSGAAMALVSLAIMARLSSWSICWPMLRRALLFSAPLVPHAAANWALNLSDRFILDHFVSSAQIGLYSLGYQFGLLVLMFGMAMNNALTPIVNQHLSDPSTASRVPPLGTYMLAGITLVGLATALLGPDLLRVMAPPRYHGATAVVPWMVLAYVLEGLYFVWSRGIWVSMRTSWVPVFTAVAAGANILLNLLLVPRFGILAAAVNSAVAFGILAVSQGLLAGKLYPIAWEYGRWVKLLSSGLICYIVGSLVRLPSPPMGVLCRAGVTLIGFPLLLAALGFVSPKEQAALAARLGRRGSLTGPR